MAEKKSRRIILKLVLTLGVLIILLIVLFETGVAPRCLLTVAGDRVGLVLTAEQVKIGFGGNLRLRRFSAAFADEESPFFAAHIIEISMNSIPAILTSRKANVSDIRLVGPVLTVRSDEGGQLNIAPLMSLGREKPDRPEPPEIPSITVINGTVSYQRFGDEAVTFSRIQFDSFQADTDTISFSLTLPGHNTLDGTFNTDTKAHTMTLQIENIAALPNQAKEDLPRTFKLQADWIGKMSLDESKRLEGDLNVRRLTMDNAEASLHAAVVFGSETAQAQINKLVVNPWPLWSQTENSHEPLSAEGGTMTFHYADRQIAIDDLHVSLLNGDAVLNVQLYPQQVIQSRGELFFTSLDLSQATTLSAFQDAMLSGSVKFEPATDTRAMEPMAVSLRLMLVGKTFETAGLQEITANGYLGNRRLVTHGVSVPVFGGEVQPWVSLTRRDEGVFAHVIADVEDIEVERLAKTFTGRDETIPGKLSGTIRGRSSGTLQTFSGSADISLTESDLMNTSIIGAVYGAMNLSFGNLDAKGNGTVKLAAQGEKIEIMSFKYFNRGVEVRGAGAIEAITQGKDSPVSGFATGSMQPLSETRVPGMRELDRLISGLQAGLAAVKIEGTLGSPGTRTIAVPEVQNALRALLWQELKD